MPLSRILPEAIPVDAVPAFATWGPLTPPASSRGARPQHQLRDAQLRSKILFQCVEYSALGVVEGLFEFLD
jgi:hypothetical protein